MLSILKTLQHDQDSFNTQKKLIKFGESIHIKSSTGVEKTFYFNSNQDRSHKAGKRFGSSLLKCFNF